MLEAVKVPPEAENFPLGEMVACNVDAVPNEAVWLYGPDAVACAAPPAVVADNAIPLLVWDSDVLVVVLAAMAAAGAPMAIAAMSKVILCMGPPFNLPT